MKKYTYLIADEKGVKVDVMGMRILKAGGIKVVSEIPLILRRVNEREDLAESHPWKHKSTNGNSKEKKIQDIEPGFLGTINIPGKPVENGVTENAGEIHNPGEILPQNEPGDLHIFPGDKIQITLNGEPTEVKVFRTFDTEQEVAVQLKGGDKLIVPAAWVIKKV